MWLFIIRLARAAMTCLNRPMKNKISPYKNTPIILPHKEPWATPEDILNYTRKCLRACGLDGWKVAFDRSKEHLGQCNCQKRIIYLERGYVDTCFSQFQFCIWRIIVHEIAHAITDVYYGGCGGHDSAWQTVLDRLGGVDQVLSRPVFTHVPEQTHLIKVTPSDQAETPRN